MTITKNSWHYKMYSWYKGYKPSSTNLCPYVRTVLLYAPLKFLFVGWVWRIPFAILFWPPLLFELPRWVGMHSYTAKTVIYLVYTMFGGGAVIITMIVGTAFLWTEVFDLDSVPTYIRLAIGAPMKLKPVTSIFTVIKEYWKAFHDGICPVIYFD